MNMLSFCPKCGKKTDGLCGTCFLESNPIGLREPELGYCKCGRYQCNGKWVKSPEDCLRELLTSNLLISRELKLEELEILKTEFYPDSIKVRFLVRARYKSETVERELETEIKIKKGVCQDCNKISGGYFQAILQYRNDQRPKIDFKREKVSNVKKVRGGWDIYITDVVYARELEAKYRKRGFHTKESSKLMGQKDGRNVYRLSISVKPPKISAGDLILHSGNVLEVLEVKKNTSCRNIVTGKQTMLPLRMLENEEIICNKKDARRGIVAAVTPKDIQVLDSNSNETFYVPNRYREIEAGQEIGFIKVGKKTHLIRI